MLDSLRMHNYGVHGVPANSRKENPADATDTNLCNDRGTGLDVREEEVMTKKPRIPMKGGDEFDGLTKAKRWFSWKPGERKRLKRKYNKRVRAEESSQ